MRVFFIGNVEFSYVMLTELLKRDDVEVVGVATKSSSSFNADHYDLSEVCTEKDIPFKYVKDINALHIISWISSFKPDFIFCFGWSALIKNDVLNIAPGGVIGYHPTALPANRGRHPIVWALVLGLESTGSTFFRMDTGADTGDIVSQEIIPINEDDDASTLYNKIKITALKQLNNFITKMISKNLEYTQQSNRQTNYWRKRGKEDGKIDFRMSTNSIYNLVRGLTKPYVGAHIEIFNSDIKIWKTKKGITDAQNHEPGKVLEIDGQKIRVKTGDGSIWIIEHEFKELPDKNSYL